MNPQDTPTEPPTLQPKNGRFSSLNPSQKLLILIAAIFVVLLATMAIYQAVHKQTPKPTSTTNVAKPSQAAVSVTDSGFSPASITIKAGTQLTWTNNGKSSHQVAADPYPANNSIPGFDSTKTLLPGDSLSFTFEQKGTFHLHDQSQPLNASFHLTVIVQ